MAKKEETRYVGENLFEGIVSFRALMEAQESGFNDRRIKTLWYSEEKLKKNKSEFSYVKAKSHQYGFEIELTPAQKIDEMTIGTSHGGIAMETTPRTINELCEEFIKDDGFYIMLDGIEDPYNFGYALRSVYAAGVDGVILAPRNWMSAAGVVCRSSAGASELLPMCTLPEAKSLEAFKDRGYKIICADIDNSKSVYDADLSRPLVLVVGGEKRGISSAVMSLADEVVRLDYARDFPAALSAASAASILAFEVLRQGRGK